MSLNKIIKYTIGAVVAIILIYMLAFIKFDVISNGEGVLAINDSNVNVLAPSSGIIKAIDVTSGDQVVEGQRLMTISNIEDSHRHKLLEYTVEFNQKGIKRLTHEISILKDILKNGKPKNSRDTNNTDEPNLLKIYNKYNIYLLSKEDLITKEKNFEIKRKNLESQEAILTKKSKLIRGSLGDTVRYLDSKLEVERVQLQAIENKLLIDEAKASVEAAYFDFFQLTLDVTTQQEEELRNTEEALQSALSEFNTVQDRIDSTYINSTVNGTVLSLKEGLDEGIFIERNTEILTLKRDDDGVFVDAKFDSKFRPYIAVGSPAKIRINAPGIKDYFHGEISSISVDSFENEEYAKQGGRYYKVKVRFDSESNENRERLDDLLGLKTSVFIVNDSMSFLEYIFSVFNKGLDFTVW